MKNKKVEVPFNPEWKIIITTFVDNYKKFYIQEYIDFIKAMKPRQDLLKENPWGKVGGKYQMEFIEQPLVEYPVTLFNILRKNLTEPEFLWFQSSDGAKWFGKDYPEFRLWR